MKAKSDDLTTLVLDEWIINQEDENNWKVSRQTNRQRKNLRTGTVLEGNVVEFIGYYSDFSNCLIAILKEGYANQGNVADMKAVLKRQDEIYAQIKALDKSYSARK